MRYFTIVTSEIPLYKISAEHLQKTSEKKGIKSELFTLSSTVVGDKVDETNLEIMRNLIKAIKMKSYAVVLYIYDSDVGHFLVLAKQVGMTNGEYMFIGIDTAYRGSQREPRYIEPHLSDSEVYQGVVTVYEDDIPQSKEWEHFSDMLELAMSRKNFTKPEIQQYYERFILSAGNNCFPIP